MICTCTSDPILGTFHDPLCVSLQISGKSGDTALHADQGKLGLQYILAMPGLDQVAKVGDYGAKKYDQWNYTKGMAWMKLLGSCSRHLASFIRGQDMDPESQLPHLAHLAYDALILLGYMEAQRALDDRHIEIKQSNNNLPF